MKSIYLAVLLALAGCTTSTPVVSTPPVPTNAPPKVSALLLPPAPKARLAKLAQPKVQIVKIPVQPVLVLPDQGLQYAFTDGGNNVLLTISNASPQVYVPNPAQVPFFRVDSSLDLGSWTILGYFTNFVNGLVFIDNDGQHLASRFFKVVPQ